MKKLLLSFAIVAVFGRCSAMRIMDEIKYNSLIKQGDAREIVVKTSEVQTPWEMIFVPCSGFAKDGDRFVFSDSTGRMPLLYNVDGALIGTGRPQLSNKSLRCWNSIGVNAEHAYDICMTLKCQALSESDPWSALGTLEHQTKKNGKESLIFHSLFTPYPSGTNPLLVNGMFYAIMAHFPCHLTSQTPHAEVIEYVEKTKHICAFVVKDKKLKLVRNFGYYPYCRGLYVNPVHPMLAVMYGNGTETEKCIKFIKFSYPSFVKPMNTFEDTIIVCEK